MMEGSLKSRGYFLGKLFDAGVYIGRCIPSSLGTQRVPHCNLGVSDADGLNWEPNVVVAILNTTPKDVQMIKSHWFGI